MDVAIPAVGIRPIISTNTAITEETVVENINIAKEIIDKWKTTVTIIKNASNTLVTVATLLPGILLLLPSTSILLGVILAALAKLLTYIMPQHIDIKLDTFAEWIFKYLVRTPLNFIDKVKPYIKKK